MKKLQLLLIALLIGHFVIAQNQPLNSQYFMNQSMLNPAYNGVHNVGNITAISRGQWVGVDGAPFTNLLTGYSTISDHSAVGFLVLNEGFGINSTTDFMFSYAYRMDFYGNYLSFGMQGGSTLYVQDYNKLSQEAPDNLVGDGRVAGSASNFGFGMMYKTDQFYIGAASPRLLKTIIADDGVVVDTYDPLYNVTGGVLITTSNFLKIKPSFVARYSRGELALDLNGQVLINEQFWLGVSSRNFNSAGFNIIYTEDEIYHFGYSFEFPFSKIGGTGYGTHEVMISIDMRILKRHDYGERYF